MNILVIGTGAIGSYYGSLLAKGGARVSVVARSDYEQVRQHGIDIRSDKLGQWHFKPHAVLRNAVEVAEKPDYVVLCTKIVDDVDQVALVRGAVGPETALVLVANGIGVEAKLAEAYPDNELISGLAFICVTRTAPGKIWHQDYGALTLGLYPRGSSAKTKALYDVFVRAGVAGMALEEDIVTARWRKCLWNAAFNPLSVTMGGKTVNEILASDEPRVRALMLEVAEIAAACGHGLPPDAIDKMVANTKKMAAYKTSMLVDYEAGRPMEIEAILGEPLRMAKERGITAFEIERLYREIGQKGADRSESQSTRLGNYT